MGLSPSAHLPRKTSCLLLALLALGLSAGCSATGPRQWIRNGFKVGPDYCPPCAPVAEGWIEGEDPNVQSRHLEDWWQVFGDPTLNDLVCTAYDQNLNLRTLGARVLEARAQLAITAGSLFPQTQQASAQFNHVGISHNTFNNPSVFSTLSPTPLPAGTMISNFYSDWTAGFNLSWELDLWGRLRRNIESADARLDASQENYDDALVTLLADVATQYVQYRVAQQRVKIATDNVRIQEGVLALAEKRLEAGTASALDAHQARTVLEATRASVPALQILLGQANDQLCILLGMPPSELAPLLGPGPDLGADPMPNTPTWVAAGIPADLLRQRPDVRSAERQVAAQCAQIGVAQADLYPALYVNGTLGYEAADLSRMFESGSFVGTITPNFRWNILNYGRIANNVCLQRARTQEMVSLYQNRVLTAAREAQSSLRGFLRSQQQAADLRRSVEAAVAATRIGGQQYQAGTVDFSRVFQLETAQVQQQDQLALSQGNVALNLVGVYRALGGGWEIRLPSGDQDATEDLPPSSPPPPEAPVQPPPPPPQPTGDSHASPKR